MGADINVKATRKDGQCVSLLTELPELGLRHQVVYFFRLRACTRPDTPNPVNANVPDSGTLTISSPITRVSANREFDTSIRKQTMWLLYPVLAYYTLQ